MLPSFAGAVAPDWIRRFVAEGGGGVMLFATNVPSRAELASLCASLRAERDDLLFAIDEEGGDVTRLEWRTGSSYPGGAALGAIDDAGADRGGRRRRSRRSSDRSASTGTSRPSPT